jgi:trehalose 6-phosphate synthase/phosphatase
MIVWNYKDTDPEFGNWQAKELTSHLEHVFCNLPIEIVHGKKCLEVIPNQLKKQKLVKLLLESLAKKFPIDFILYIGDDTGNEPVFTYLNNKKQQSSKMLSGVS